jgi:hypothetical protein
MTGPLIALAIIIAIAVEVSGLRKKLLRAWKQKQFDKAHRRTQSIIAAYKTNQTLIAQAQHLSAMRLGADGALASTLDHQLVCTECSQAFQSLMTRPE